MKFGISANVSRTSVSRHLTLRPQCSSLLIFKVSFGKGQVVSFLLAFYLLKIVIGLFIRIIKTGSSPWTSTLKVPTYPRCSTGLGAPWGKGSGDKRRAADLLRGTERVSSKPTKTSVWDPACVGGSRPQSSTQIPRLASASRKNATGLSEKS